MLGDETTCKLAGLGARDTLRLEAGLCLYGNDIDDTTTPVEAGLSWLVSKKRRTNANFPGASVIVGQLAEPAKVSRRRIALISRQGPPPRHGTEVLAPNSLSVIGTVTSGNMSPSLGKGVNIAMAYVDNPHFTFKKFQVKVRGKNYDADVAKAPFVPTHYYIIKK